jgi:hypothetical protein
VVAIFIASQASSASGCVLVGQASSLRECRSRTVAGYNLPSSVEISVISPHHLVFGAAAVKSRRTKSGNFGAVLSCFLSPRRCLGFRPSKPWRRIESATVFTLTDQPSSIKSAWMRGEPYVPPEVANAALIVASSSSRRSCWSVGLRSSHL